MNKNILIVEDDEFLRELISKKLVSEGFAISVAFNGEEGVKKAEELKPDLILLDIILPVMDGFETLEKIKENPSTKPILVIILSNLGQQEEIDRGLSLGAVDYLVKAQLAPEEIVEKVKNVLR